MAHGSVASAQYVRSDSRDLILYYNPLGQPPLNLPTYPLRHQSQLGVKSLAGLRAHRSSYGLDALATAADVRRLFRIALGIEQA